MTNKEAIRILERLQEPEAWESQISEDAYTALQMAIDALGKDRNVPSKTFTVIDLKTGKEADPYDIALHEDWAKHLMYCDMEGFAIEEDGSLILVDECGRFEYCPVGRFEVRWDEG